MALVGWERLLKATELNVLGSIWSVWKSAILKRVVIILALSENFLTDEGKEQTLFYSEVVSFPCVRVSLQDSSVGQEQHQPSGSTGRSRCSGEVSMKICFMFHILSLDLAFLVVWKKKQMMLNFSPHQELHHPFHACSHHGRCSGTESEPREDRGRLTKGYCASFKKKPKTYGLM